MRPHTLKGLRKEFKAIGKFHTPPELIAIIAVKEAEKQAKGQWL